MSVWKKPAMGWLWVACWCGESDVQLEVERIGDATSSCGRPGCVPPSDYCPLCGCRSMRWAGCEDPWHGER